MHQIPDIQGMESDSYIRTFVRVSPDCPVTTSEIPLPKNGQKTAHLLQYELLTSAPYTYNHESLIYAVYVIRQGLSQDVIDRDGEKIWTELFSKGHPCLRASALIKRYGFGAHYNEAGKIALYAMESPEYQSLSTDKDIKQLAGMKTKR